MKKLLMLLVLASIGLIFAQSEEQGYDEATEAEYGTHNDEGTSSVTTDEIITNDPSVITSLIGTGTEEVQNDQTPEMDLTASAEFKYSENLKQIVIPFWYRWREFRFNASVPYIIDKKVPVGVSGDMQDAIYESSSGLSDITIGASYGKYLDQYNLYIDGNLSVKLPTGDEENKESFDQDPNWAFSLWPNNEALIPLGSGTTDITASVSGYYFMDDLTFKGTALYKMNGSKTLKANYLDLDTFMWEDEDDDVGDNLIFTAGADYRFPYRFTTGVNIVYGIKFSDDFDKSDNPKNGLTYMDVLPVVKYSISLFEFVAGAKIPVMTKLETYGETDPMMGGVSKDIQETRNFSFFFRTNYRIF